VFILLHWLSSSYQVSKLWTKRNLGHDLVPSLPTHFQIWFIETQRSVVICPGFTSGWWKSQDWLNPWSHDSLSICIALTVPLDQWSYLVPWHLLWNYMLSTAIWVHCIQTFEDQVEEKQKFVHGILDQLAFANSNNYC